MADSTAICPAPRSIAVSCLAGWIALGGWLIHAPAAERIALNAHMLINLSGQRPGTEQVDEQAPAGDSNVRVCRFRSDGRPFCDVYAVWCPTSNQTQVSAFSLDLPQGSKATLIALQPDSAAGQETPLAIADGKATFDVSERPVFVVAQ